MSRKKPPSSEEVLKSLIGAGFEVKSASGKTIVSKHGCAAILNENAGLTGQPGVLMGGEISRLVDKGNQKFLKISKLEVPATAESLRSIHLFTEELKLVTGEVNLYNESLGTVSDRYTYDR